MRPRAHRKEATARICGEGIEIGAYHSPLAVPAGCRVRYVDLYSRDEAELAYPGADNSKERVVVPEILAPADDLTVLPDQSQDFVLTSHLIEHLADPLRGLREWHRLLRPQGSLVLIVPDRRYTFDRRRSATSVDHLVADHREGTQHPERHRRDRQHCADFARYVNGLHEPRHIDFFARLLHESGYPIHYHCWTLAEFLPIFEALRTWNANFAFEWTFEAPADSEFVVARRSPS